MMSRSILVPVVALAAFSLAAGQRAEAIDWVGGNDPWDGDIFNWSPNDEPDPADPVVFNTNNHVEMAMDNEIASLTMSNSIELDTESFFLDVNGDITLSDSGTILRAGESNTVGLPATSVSAYNITVNSGATYANANFTSFIHPTSIGVFDINGGTLFGHGTIRNGDGIGSSTAVFVNDGVIRPGSVVEGLVVIGPAPAARTLTLAAIDSDARIDLDGTTGGGALDIQRNQTLDINVQVDDDFDGVIDLAHNSTLDIEDAWEFAGTMNVNNGFVAGTPPFIPNVPADVAYLQGGAITMNESTTTINVLDADGTLQFDAELTADDGTIDNTGLIVFNQDATINAGVDFQMNGINASMTVGPGATVTINDDDMDFDGGGASTNVITVEDGGFLDLNLDSFEGNDRADGFLTLNSGAMALTVTDGSWTMERRLTLNNNGAGTPIVSGSEMVVGDDTNLGTPNDADIRVEGTGTSQITANVTFNSDTEVDVEADATLAITGFSTFNSVNGADSAQFDGPGDIYFSGGQVNEATTLNFSGGTVGLDGGGGGVLLLAAPDFTIDAPLTINAAALDEYGRTINFPFAQTSELTVNANLGGQLDVNLDNANDSWTVNDNGVVHLNGGAIFFETAVDGSDWNMNGTMNVDGLTRVDSRVSFGSTAVVNFNDAAANLRLRGGDLVSTNRLEGGNINGIGELSAQDGVALHGHGSISANIDFDGATSQLQADDGTLTLGGSILDVGVLGTADTDGVLSVTSPWSTSDTTEVRLNGGQLVGATITNDGLGGINGRGLVSARVINDTVIAADAGGTLVVDHAGNNNDWDGPSNTAALRAFPGSTLEIRDNASFLFNGTVAATSGTVRSTGFELEFDPGSTLALDDGGRYQSSNATDVGGTVLIGAGAPSRVTISGSLTFENTSSTTLTGDLELNANTIVEPGATFAGGGALQNLNGSTLNLLDGADVDVLVENSGLLSLGSSPGQVTGLDFQQNADGTWDVELGGLGLSDFDRMTLTGAASLDGTLDLSLIGGYVPVLGDTLNILSATGGIVGSFGSIVQPASMPADLMFDVNNLGSILQLEVVDIPSFTADFDMDGDVDEFDLAQWEGDYGGPGSDANGDGTSNGTDFLAWQQQNGSGVAPIAAFAAAAAVPEPSTLLLAGFATCGLVATRRKK